MSAAGTMNFKSFSCSTAAANSSACNFNIMDTAVVLAVSICVRFLLRICLAGM